MVDIQEQLKKLSLSLPDAPAPAANYLPYVISNNLLFVSGQISSDKNGLIKGVVGKNMSIEEGYLAAQNCGLSLIAHLNSSGLEIEDGKKKPLTFTVPRKYNIKDINLDEALNIINAKEKKTNKNFKKK